MRRDMGSVGILLETVAHQRGLAVTRRGANLSFVDASLRADHIGIARVDRQGVRPCRLSLHALFDLELSHAAITFLIRFSAHITSR